MAEVYSAVKISSTSPESDGTKCACIRHIMTHIDGIYSPECRPDKNELRQTAEYFKFLKSKFSKAGAKKYEKMLVFLESDECILSGK